MSFIRDEDPVEPLADLARTLTPRERVAPPAWVLQARRNAEARQALLREWGALTGAQVADLAGNTATNRDALASRWRRERRVLAVDHADRTLFPGFQFDPATGRPRRVMREALQALARAGVDGWPAALWFTSPTAALDDARPVDLIASEPHRVVEAAERLADVVW